ncbi:MAG: hypothetical protein V9E90_09135 [Saprospiraceae bacterium]
MNKTVDKGFILSTSSNGQITLTSCYAKLDSNYNLLWTKSYYMSPGGYLDYAAELEDRSFVGLAEPKLSDGVIFVRSDFGGNLLQAYSYMDINSAFVYSGSICKSASNDTGYVALIGQCSIDYGLVKFNKNGSILWAYEYGSEDISGVVYNLTLGYEHGYISKCVTTNKSIPERLASLVYIGNNGQFIRARKYSILPSSSNSTAIHTASFLSKDTSYYLAATLGHFNPSSSSTTYENEAYILNIDTNLLVKRCWKLSTPNQNHQIYIVNFANTKGNELIISGYIRDIVTYRTQLFILKFYPTINGNIIWCKTFHATSNTWNYITSIPREGMIVAGMNDDIVFPVHAAFDGSCIAGIDSSGSGLCNTSDFTLNVSQWKQCISSPLIITPKPINLMPLVQTLPEAIIEYNDSLICSNKISGSTQLNLKNPSSKMISFNVDHNSVRILNLSNNSVRIEIYTLSGSLMNVNKLEINSTCNFPITIPGLYILNAKSINGVQKERFVFNK